jgi:2',3'-cyclic-nucleotide 2'-phosphodiesterase (5'-nucleotidase family)
MPTRQCFSAAITVLIAIGLIACNAPDEVKPATESGATAIPVSPPDKLSIFYTADTRGHIDPCECSSGMAGGIARRMTFVEDQALDHFLLVDAGDVTAGAREWELLELEYILKGYAAMGYHAVNVGHREIQAGAAGLADLRDQFPNFISANVRDSSGDLIFDPYKVVTLAGGYRVAILGIADNTLESDEIGAGLQLDAPNQAVAKYLPEASKRSDMVVLLAFANEERLQALAEEFIGLDVIVGGNVAQPSGEAVEQNRSVIVYNTDKGKSVGRLDLALVEGGHGVIANEVTMLLEEIADDPDAAAIVEAFKIEQVNRDFQDYKKDDEEGLTAL